MRTIKLTIEYDGTNYCGWQIQPSGRSVQGELCRAVRKMTGEGNHVIGASRTDAGVHAMGQVAHFRTSTTIPPSGFMNGINSQLRGGRGGFPDISVIDAEEAKADFHAQKDAKAKLYRYLILNGPAPTALNADRFWQVRDKLNVAAMKKAAKCLIGRHDFKSFQAAGSSAKDAVRRVYKIVIASAAKQSRSSVLNDNLISIDITGNGFVYHMVRNIVGTLVEIGKGRLEPGEMKDILKARERKRAGATAPAHGLYLVRVVY